MENITEAVEGLTKTFSLGIKVDDSISRPEYISAQFVNGGTYNWNPTVEPIYEALYYHSQLAYYRTCVTLLSDYIILDNKNDILELLKSFDESIQDISIVGEDIYLHSTTSGTLPLFAYGLGLQKVVMLCGLIASNKGGIILIDEIDNAIHISAFTEVLGWFINACLLNNIQAFITTHSGEALDTIISNRNYFYVDEDLMRIITLRKDPNNLRTRVKIRTGREAFNDREQYEMELRI